MSYIKGQEILLGNNWYRVENEDPLIIRKIKLKSINSLRLPIKLEDELYIYRYKQTDRFPMLHLDLYDWLESRLPKQYSSSIIPSMKFLGEASLISYIGNMGHHYIYSDELNTSDIIFKINKTIPLLDIGQYNINSLSTNISEQVFPMVSIVNRGYPLEYKNKNIWIDTYIDKSFTYSHQLVPEVDFNYKLNDYKELYEDTYISNNIYNTNLYTMDTNKYNRLFKIDNSKYIQSQFIGRYRDNVKYNIYQKEYIHKVYNSLVAYFGSVDYIRNNFNYYHKHYTYPILRVDSSRNNLLQLTKLFYTYYKNNIDRIDYYDNNKLIFMNNIKVYKKIYIDRYKKHIPNRLFCSKTNLFLVNNNYNLKPLITDEYKRIYPFRLYSKPSDIFNFIELGKDNDYKPIIFFYENSKLDNNLNITINKNRIHRKDYKINNFNTKLNNKEIDMIYFKGYVE